MQDNKNTGGMYTPPRMQFESVVMELVGFSAQDVITTSNATGFDGSEDMFNLDGTINGGGQDNA